MIQQEFFGNLPDGRGVDRFTLSNQNGMTARVITYGATLSELHVPDHQGQLDDVVLGYDNLEAYLTCRNYLGPVIGRVSGRMAHGRFEVDGTEYAVVVNDPPNHLHGGLQGFDKRLWSLLDMTGDTLRLQHISPHGEEGYPGEVRVIASFQLTEANEFVILFKAETDRPTPLCLTQHNCFNLGGHASKDIHDHVLTIFSQEVIPTEKSMTLSNQREEVHGKPNDFNHCVRIGDVLDVLWEQHGDMYLVRRTRRGDFVPAARLEHPVSGRILNIATTEDCIQLYTGKHIHGENPGKTGKPYDPHAGLCLNCQGYPNGASCLDFGSIVLRPGTPYHHQTVLAFRTVAQDRCSR